MKKYTVYVIFAFDSINEKGMFVDSVELQLIDTSAASALNSARKMIPRKEYYLKTIIEKYV